MHRENVQRTIDYLREAPDENLVFNMRYFFIGPEDDAMEIVNVSKIPAEPECNTIACIAGHIAFKFGREASIENQHVESFAQEFLGLDYEQARYLFMGQFNPSNRGGMEGISRSEAIAELERMLVEGPRKKERHIA